MHPRPLRTASRRLSIWMRFQRHSPLTQCFLFFCTKIPRRQARNRWQIKPLRWCCLTPAVKTMLHLQAVGV
jgi:hypothetical protein